MAAVSLLDQEPLLDPGRFTGSSGRLDETRELDYLLLDASFFRYHAGATVLAEPVLAAW